jgi:PAS domain S-box-containing protein
MNEKAKSAKTSGNKRGRINSELPKQQKGKSNASLPSRGKPKIKVHNPDNARKKIEEGEERARTILSHVLDAFWIINKEGSQIIDVNHAMCQMLGYTREELLKMSVSDVTADDSPKMVEQKLQQAIRDVSLQFPSRFRRKDGAVIDVEVSVTYLLSKNLIFGFHRDITERLRTETALSHSHKLMRYIIEHNRSAVAVHDRNMNYIYVSQRYLDDYKVKEQNIIGKHHYEVFPDLPQKWREVHQRVLKGEVLSAEDDPYIREDGAVDWTRWECRPWYESDDSIGGLIVYTEIITERKRTEEALKENEERFRTLYENTSIGLYRTTPDGSILLANPALVKMLGYESFEDMQKRNLEEQNDAEYTRTQFREWMERDGSVSGIESKWRKKDGTHIFVRESARLTSDRDGKAVYYEGTVEDITERKQAEEALRESEQRARALLKVIPDMMFRLDRQGVFLDYNAEGRDLYVASEEIIGRKSSDLLPHELADLVDRDIRKTLETGAMQTFEYQLPIRERGIREYEARMVPSGKDEVTAIVRDITERKLSEETLRQSAQRLDLALNGAELGLWDLNFQTGKAITNHRFLQILGYQPGEIEYTFSLWEQSLHPEDRDRAMEIFQTHLTGATPFYETEHRVRMKSGEYCWVLGKGRLIEQDDAGQPLRIIGTVLDITERKKAEQHIRVQLDRLNALHNIDNVISSSFDLRTTLEIFMEHVTAQLNVDAVSVLLLNKHSMSLERVASRGFRSTTNIRSSFGMGDGVTGQAILNRKPVYIPNLAEPNLNLGREFQRLADESFVAYYGLPLIAKGQTIGVLEVFSRIPLDAKRDWVDFLETLAGQAAIAIDNAQLFENLQRSNFDLTLAYDATIEGWSRATDMRDKETDHTRRVADQTWKLALAMKFNESDLIHVRRGALLHDIGKLGVPDSILFKTGELNDEEWMIVREHPKLAYSMLSPIQYLKPALDIPYCHHEKWDGTGYPRGLKGEQIPFAARIFAVIDVWDALINPRPYRPPWTEEQARDYIQEQKGKHFDPQVVDAFMELLGSGFH